MGSVNQFRGELLLLLNMAKILDISISVKYKQKMQDING